MNSRTYIENEDRGCGCCVGILLSGAVFLVLVGAVISQVLGLLA